MEQEPFPADRWRSTQRAARIFVEKRLARPALNVDEIGQSEHREQLGRFGRATERGAGAVNAV
jgi:hypothetical protein